MKELWQNDWERIQSLTPSKLSQHDAVSRILEKFNFDYFVDVGPGLVGSEAWSCKKLKPEIQIIGYEPQYTRFKLLKEAGYPGDLYLQAVSEKSGLIQGFTGHPDGKSDFWLNVPDDLLAMDAYRECTIESVTIDEIFDKNNIKKGFIWADIEGAELSMLKGAKKALENRWIVGLNLELNFHHIEGHCTSDEVISYLKQYEYYTEVEVVKKGTHKDYIFKPN